MLSKRQAHDFAAQARYAQLSLIHLLQQPREIVDAGRIGIAH